MKSFSKRILPREKGDIVSYAFAPGKAGRKNLFFFVMFTKKKFELGDTPSKWPFSKFVDGSTKGLSIWNTAIGFSKVYETTDTSAEHNSKD